MRTFSPKQNYGLQVHSGLFRLSFTYSQVESEANNVSKNYLGLMFSGQLFLGNLSLVYARNLLQKDNYRFNVETGVIFGYKFTRYTNNIGLSTSFNNVIGRFRHKFIIGIGITFLCSPSVLKYQKEEMYSSTGMNEPKETINVFLAVGWKYNFAKHWGVRITYNPGINFKNVWDFPKYPVTPKYRFQPSFIYTNFGCLLFFIF